MRMAYLCAAAFSLTSCGGNEVQESGSGAPPSRPIEAPAVPADAWASLAASRVYFGHQSVGGNLIEGLRELSAGTPGPVTIVRGRRGPGTAALVEFPIGENGQPASKILDFAAALDQLGDGVGDIAMFKYCYLDITPHTDVQALFAQHRDAVREMRRRHPELDFVHVTAPLTTLEPGPKMLLKRLLGKPTTRDANAKRNEFNAMLRKEYAGEPMFDLARIESTRLDGSRSFFIAGADTVYTLAAELTDDGGHLNRAGRRAAAAEFANVVGRVAAARNAR